MQSTPAEKSVGLCSSYIQVLWAFMVMILEELCQRKFTQEEVVEISCNERGKCSGVWKVERAYLISNY